MIAGYNLVGLIANNGNQNNNNNDNNDNINNNNNQVRFMFHTMATKTTTTTLKTTTTTTQQSGDHHHLLNMHCIIWCYDKITNKFRMWTRLRQTRWVQCQWGWSLCLHCLLGEPWILLGEPWIQQEESWSYCCLLGAPKVLLCFLGGSWSPMALMVKKTATPRIFHQKRCCSILLF